VRHLLYQNCAVQSTRIDHSVSTEQLVLVQPLNGLYRVYRFSIHHVWPTDSSRLLAIVLSYYFVNNVFYWNLLPINFICLIPSIITNNTIQLNKMQPCYTPYFLHASDCAVGHIVYVWVTSPGPWKHSPLTIAYPRVRGLKKFTMERLRSDQVSRTATRSLCILGGSPWRLCGNCAGRIRAWERYKVNEYWEVSGREGVSK
jgi:hypothetical protein